MSKFQIGDRVWWASQAGGYLALKVGEVVDVIPFGVRPQPGGALGSQPGNARDHESYIVRAGIIPWPRPGQELKSKPKHVRRYWPRVKQLRLEADDGWPSQEGWRLQKRRQEKSDA